MSRTTPSDRSPLAEGPAKSIAATVGQTPLVELPRIAARSGAGGRLFAKLENLRDAHSPIRVLHEAVTLAGIADMGPMLPMLSNLGEAQRAPVREAAIALRQHDEQLAPS